MCKNSTGENEMTMSKTDRDAYREYEKSCTDKKVTPLSADDWFTARKVEQEAKDEKEKQAYLEYQKRVSSRGEPVLTKEEWIAKHKPSGETRAERFVRLVEPRVNKALRAIKSLEHLNSPAYASSRMERLQVIEALKKGLSDLEVKYLAQKDLTGFKLAVPQKPEQLSELPE